VPLAVAVPWVAADATATLAAAPPERFSVMALFVLLKSTCWLTAPAMGAAGFTVMLTVAAEDVPVTLVAVYVKLSEPV